jgi:hypothetical protein
MPIKRPQRESERHPVFSRWSAGLVALALVPTCTTQPQEAAVSTTAESMVGKTYWLHPPTGTTVSVCLTPKNPPSKDCPRAAWGKFQVTKVVTQGGLEFFEIEADNGKRGYVPITYTEYFMTEAAHLEKEGRKTFEQRNKTCNPTYLEVGMGWRDVERFCPGSPDRRITSGTTSGESIMLEYKHYPGPTHVHVLNGKVISVQMLEGY